MGARSRRRGLPGLQDLEGAAEHTLNSTLDPNDIFGVPLSLEDCDRLLRKARLYLPQSVLRSTPA